MTKNLLQTYFKQDDELPPSLREAFAEALPDEAIRVYALSDLDDQQRYSERWLVLGERHLILAEPDRALSNGHMAWTTHALPLRDIEKFELLEGLSSSRLHVISTKNELLASLQFTRRQAPAVGNLQFVAEQTRKHLLENTAPKELAGDFDPASEYQDAVLKAVKEAKATLAMPKMGVMLRLLAYLKPHKKPVTVGLLLAVLLTGLQLLPP
jgi:hypothetical protein